MTEIDTDLFYSCSNLESVYIPKTVKYIRDCAFENCGKLKHVYYGGTSKQWNAISIDYGNDVLSSAQLHTGSSGILNEDFEFSVNKDGTLTITEYKGDDSSVIIPSKINGKKVTAIGESVFQSNYDLLSVVISEGITTIGRLAFWNCKNLEKIIVPSSVNSIDYAFWGCVKLTEAGPIGSGANIEIDFGSQVKSIFSGVNIYSDGSAGWSTPTGGLFSYLEYIELPESITTICDYAFTNCTELYSIELPDSVTSIGKYAFYACGYLDEINMPSSLTYIGPLAFKGTSISEAVFSNKLTKIDPQALEGADCLERVVIPDSVVSIGYNAFSDCISLTDITIPDSVTTIESDAFRGCSSLENISLPDSMTSIGMETFKNCSALKEIVIPEGVTGLQYSTFEGCTSLRNVTLPEGLIGLYTAVFKNCTQLTSITIPSEVYSIGNEALKGCTNLRNVVVESTNGLSIRESSFEDCVSLTGFEISSITYLGTRAFAGCTSLEEVCLIKAERVGDYAFMNCDSLQTVKLTNKLTEIGTGAFRYCPDGIDIIFYGTKAQWNQVTVKNYNAPLKKANIIYMAVPTSISFKVQKFEVSYGDTVKLPVTIQPSGTDPSLLT